MSRANRTCGSSLVWHITHRCHNKDFLLRFARDRRRWRHWLFVAQRRYRLTVLDYVVTSNHVHLLVRDNGQHEIAPSIQLIASRVAQEYNRRKNRRGAFWEDRYHTTAVATDGHLLACMTYIDLNMVRAGVVAHPREWPVCGYNEIMRPPQRKAVICVETLCRYLNSTSVRALRRKLDAAIDDELPVTRRDGRWTEEVAVGSDAYLRFIQLQDKAEGRRPPW